MLILNSWLPPSAHATKQARTVHALSRLEPSELLALSSEYWRYSELRETRAESSSYNKVLMGTTHNFVLVKLCDWSLWEGDSLCW